MVASLYACMYAHAYMYIIEIAKYRGDEGREDRGFIPTAFKVLSIFMCMCVCLCVCMWPVCMYVCMYVY